MAIVASYSEKKVLPANGRYWDCEFSVVRGCDGFRIRRGKVSYLFVQMWGNDCSVMDVVFKLRGCRNLGEHEWGVIGMLRYLDSDWISETYPAIAREAAEVRGWGLSYCLLIKEA